MNNNLQPFRIDAQRGDDSLHARDVALMVSAPDIDDFVEMPFHKFVVVISNIGGEIGRHAVAADHDIILVFT